MVDTAKGDFEISISMSKKKGFLGLSGINHNFSSAVGRKPGITNMDATEMRFYKTATEL